MGRINGFFGNASSFKERSNFRKGLAYYASKTKKKWCRNHPTSVWLPGYDKCFQGFKKNEPCKEGGDE